ncbi:unnamed protein product [Mytilus coruscus]|uniref:Uncharacterized protein n=1 Tax=Mytilus coruscus TaxID=42192 RepID=A0A6J8DX46_MYTCO|nr:unnamed protein product [Mytilus coruscus]
MTTTPEDIFKLKILDCLLELSLFTEGMVPKVNSLNFETTKSRIREILPWITDIDFIRAGSVADQLFLTKFQEKGFHYNTDLDFIFVPQHVCVVWPQEKSVPPETVAIVRETRDPMYVKLLVNKNSENILPKAILKIDENSMETFVSSNQFLLEFQKRINHEQIAVEISGPSQQIQNCNIIQPDADNISSVDLVFALKLSQWPQNAEEWKGRIRPNAWPEPILVKEISGLDIHLVAKGNIEGDSPDLEWRLSFNLAERRLAEILSQKEKQCLLVTKTLLKEIDVEDGLSSYHLKSVLWWMLERGPLSRDEWSRQSLATCFLAYLKEVRLAIETKTVDNYFVPKHNMIQHLDDLPLQNTLEKISKIQDDPISSILSSVKLMENPRFFFSLSPLDGYEFDDLKTMIRHGYDTVTDKKLTDFFVYHFYNAGLPLVSNPNQRNKVVTLLKKIAQLKCVKETQESFAVKHLVKYCFECIHSGDYSNACEAIAVLNEIQEIYEIKQTLASYKMDNKDVATLFHNTGCVFLRWSKLSFWEERKNTDLQCAELFFKTAADLINNVAHNAEYVHFLYTQERFNESLEQATHAVELTHGNDDWSLLSYDITDIDVIDTSIQRHVVKHEQITAPAIVFAYYFLVRSLFQLKRKEEAIQKVYEMRSLVHRVPPDDRYDSLSMTGYACLPIDLFEEAKELFTEARNIKSAVLQSENIELCNKLILDQSSDVLYTREVQSSDG